MATEKVEDMIRKGYMVFEANTEYAGQPWELPANVLADYTVAFNELRDLDAASTESQTQKENKCAKSADEQSKCEKLLWDLKKFIRVVQPDEDLQQQMFHDLGIDDKFHIGDSEFLKLLYEQVKPHLDDWDGTDQEIPAATKTEIDAQITAYATAVGDCDEWKANATTATEAVQQGVAAFITERARVRNWLYLKLPDQKYDAHLDEYGFEIWSKPTYSGGEEEPPAPEWPDWPGPADFEANYLGKSIVELVYGPVTGAIKGTIRRRKTPAMNWEIVTEGLPMDENRVPFRDTKVEPGDYEYEFVSYNAENEPSVAAYDTVTVPETEEEVPK